MDCLQSMQNAIHCPLSQAAHLSYDWLINMLVQPTIWFVFISTPTITTELYFGRDSMFLIDVLFDHHIFILLLKINSFLHREIVNKHDVQCYFECAWTESIETFAFNYMNFIRPVTMYRT